MRDVLPVNVLTGFLGSGKTTLLTRLLGCEAFGDSAVLVNEFGEIGLDQHLIGEIAPQTVLLENGCVCCALRGELSDALLALYRRRRAGEVPPFRRLVIETTGLAEPGPILATLLHDPALRRPFRLGRVVTTVDAVNGARQLERADESLQQAAVADRLVITKTDLSDDARLGELSTALTRINPTAPQLDGSRLNPATLFAPRRSGARERLAETRRWLTLTESGSSDQHGRHHSSARAYTLTLDRRIDWSAFGIWLSLLLHRHGDRILRVKGLLDVDGAPGPVLLNGVQHLVYPPQHLPQWPDDDRRSRLVLILRGDLDGAEIERSLATFLDALG